MNKEARTFVDVTAISSNGYKQPTEAQKHAGNYKKQYTRIAGMQIAIENPYGSTRSGTSPDGKKWTSTMHAHYGYFLGTTARDKDAVDCFIHPTQKQRFMVYVVNQVDPKTKQFDEHKVILGCRTKEEAKQLYLANYEKGWQGLGSIKAVTLPDFKTWVYSNKPKKGAYT
jgi:hypothetical protein